jgi:hypothetical protein
MAKPKQAYKTGSKKPIQFTFIEFIIVSVCLMAVAGLLTHKFFTKRQSPVVRHEPWGELVAQDFKLERPLELFDPEETMPEPQTWSFERMNAEQTKALFVANGLTPEEAEKALAANRISQEGDMLVFTPAEEFLFSLSLETRQKLYAGMYGRSVSRFLDFPCVFPGKNIEAIYSDPRLHPDDVAFLKKLVYPGENSTKFSDYWLLLSKIPTSERRLAMAQVLSQLPAVLPSLRIRPDSDLNEIAAYWGQMENVRFNHLRPMLESLKRRPDGGTLDLVFLLPPFARARLFTYPAKEAGDPQMDCQWTTFNFSNLELDHRYNDAGYAANQLKNNYNQIPTPSAYGDLVLLVNERMEIYHSGVYLADDLVFTKYGNNKAQPWMIVRMADMLAAYPKLKPGYMRKKTS